MRFTQHLFSAFVLSARQRGAESLKSQAAQPASAVRVYKTARA